MDSLLREHLPEARDHEDSFALRLRGDELPALPAATVLAAVTRGFPRPAAGGRGVDDGPAQRAGEAAAAAHVAPGLPGVVAAGAGRGQRFAGRFPVLAQRIDAGGRRAQVLLGADDRHLRFRSCVGVRSFPGGDVVVTLGTRVHCLNGFGRVYMALIDRVHRGYVSPALMRPAVEHALATLAPAPRRCRRGRAMRNRPAAPRRAPTTPTPGANRAPCSTPAAWCCRC